MFATLINDTAKLAVRTLLLFAAISSALASPLVERLSIITSAHTDLCPSTATSRDLGHRLEVLAAQIEPSLAQLSRTAEHRVATLNSFIFNSVGVRSSTDLHDPCNLFPVTVLERKQGYCVGIAALYLVLAERLNLPILAVSTPTHVFLRYVDGTTTINIETIERGAAVSDEQYMAREKISASSIRKGVFMRGLTTDQFLAQVHNNLGVIYSERRAFARAAVEYEMAQRLSPRFPAAWYNHGNDLLAQGDAKGAVRAFSNSLHLHPSDAWALNNRGRAYRRLGKTRKAIQDFDAALEIDPSLEAAFSSADTP